MSTSDKSVPLMNDRCSTCVEAGIECPKGYKVTAMHCEDDPDRHSFVLSRPRCQDTDWRYCPHCGSGLQGGKP